MVLLRRYSLAVSYLTIVSGYFHAALASRYALLHRAQCIVHTPLYFISLVRIVPSINIFPA
jgi:hypothetical protein